MVQTCVESMEKENLHSVLAVSHSGACYQFLGQWQDPTEEVEKGFPNHCIFKYEYETATKSFSLLEVMRPTIEIEVNENEYFKS